MASDAENIRQIKQTLQEIKDSQDLIFSWVKGIDDTVQEKFAEIDEIEEHLISIQKHEYKLLRDEIDAIKRQLPN